jgi:hypothetical protein
MGPCFLIGGHGKRWDVHSTIAVQIKRRIIEKPVTEFLQTNVASPIAPNGLSSGLFVQQGVDNLPLKLSNSHLIFIFYIEEHTMNNRLRLGYIGIAIMLVSCGSPATPVPATPNLQATVKVMVADVVRAQPSQTPYPTYTVIPTDTPTPTPEGTATPTATPTQPPSPTPDPRLFWDDFENGIKPDWHMQGERFASANGKLVASSSIETFIGDATWNNYIVLFHGLEVHSKWQLMVRAQDRDNYMMMQCTYNEAAGEINCDWYKVQSGQEVQIPGTHSTSSGSPDPLRIEVQGNTYRFFSNGEKKVTFTDDTYTNGGFGLRVMASEPWGIMQLDGFEVKLFP